MAGGSTAPQRAAWTPWSDEEHAKRFAAAMGVPPPLPAGQKRRSVVRARGRSDASPAKKCAAPPRATESESGNDKIAERFAAFFFGLLETDPEKAQLLYDDDAVRSHLMCDSPPGTSAHIPVMGTLVPAR